MKKPLLLIVLALALSACGGDDAQKKAKRQDAGPKPNIVLIVADDLGISDTSIYPGGRFPTPNIEKLAAGGVRFAQAYSSSSVSGPARAGLLTGRHPSRFGYEYDNGPGTRDQEEKIGLPQTEETLAGVLKAAGYRTAAVGIWGLGGVTSDSPLYPTKRGFDSFFGSLAGETAYQDQPGPGVVTVTSEGEAAPTRSMYSMLVQGPDASPVPSQDYATDVFAREAVNVIGEAAGDKTKPFFLYLAFNAPSLPLQAPQRHMAAFANITDPRQRAYAAMVASLDEAVGTVLAELDRQGLAQNTIVVFTADNGCNALAQVCDCNTGVGAPTLHEGGLRVPLVIRWPAKLPQGVVYAHPVSTVDVFTTAMVAARAQRPAGVRLDGVNLAPYVLGTKKGMPREALVWLRRPMTAMRLGNWKIIDDPIMDKRLVYDLAADPAEKNNLAEKDPEKARELRAQLIVNRSFAADPKWLSRGEVEVKACGTTTEVLE